MSAANVLSDDEPTGGPRLKASLRRYRQVNSPLPYEWITKCLDCGQVGSRYDTSEEESLYISRGHRC